MADTYNLISIISFVLAAVLFLLSLFMFFKFNIRKIIGDLSGRNARKSIDAMKREVKVVEQQPVNDMVYKREIKESSVEFESPVYSNIAEDLDKNITTSSDDENANANETMVLSEGIGTTVLSETMGTTVLSQEQLLPPEKRLVLTKEITFIHGAVTLW